MTLPGGLTGGFIRLIRLRITKGIIGGDRVSAESRQYGQLIGRWYFLSAKSFGIASKKEEGCNL